MEKVLEEQKWLNKGNSQEFFVFLKQLRKTSLPQKLRKAEDDLEHQEDCNDKSDGNSGSK